MEGLIESERVLQAPAGRAVDDFILQLAARKRELGNQVYVMTNDRFPEKGPATLHRIAFLKVVLEGREEWLFSPALESIMPNVGPLSSFPHQMP